MSKPFAVSYAFVLGACLTVGCSGDNKVTASSPEANADKPSAGGQSDESDPSEEAAAEGGNKAKVVEGSPPGSDERYALTIETPEAKAGEEAQVVVRVVPKDPWHMNLDFPTSLAVDAPSGVQMAKADLKKGDAAALDEDKCQFDVKFTASEAGDKSFTGKFKFAVCQDEACSPVTEDVEFKVAVK